MNGVLCKKDMFQKYHEIGIASCGDSISEAVENLKFAIHGRFYGKGCTLLQRRQEETPAATGNDLIEL